MSEIKKPNRHSPSPRVQAKHVSSPIRDRVLKAAFSLFREHGFSSTSMLDIVTRARISKRDLYALFRNKHAVLRLTSRNGKNRTFVRREIDKE
jgi:AcrR family transcriptional regulator